MPRSGTTLLSNMFNTTDVFFVPEETHLYQLLSNTKASLDYEFLLSSFYRKFWPIEDSEIVSLNYENRKDLLISMLIKFKEKRGVSKRKVLGEKTPIHFKHIETILEDFPKATIINIIRDPRDVLYSIKKAKWNLFFDLIKRVEEYKCNVQSCYLDESIITIKYENLIDNPKLVLGPIFLAINPAKKGVEFAENSLGKGLNFDSKLEPWKVSVSGDKIVRSRVYQWRSRKSVVDELVEYLLRDEIEIVGYDNSRKQLSIKGKVYWCYCTLLNGFLKFIDIQ